MINLEIKDRIAFITMHNAEHFNCLSEEMCESIIHALDEAYSSECVGVVIKFLAQLRRNSVLSLSAIKRQFRILSRAASTISSESFERINDYRRHVFQGEDYKEGIRSFLEKRAPEYHGKATDLD